MNHVLLVVKSSDILSQITALHIWGSETDFEITAVCSSIQELNQMVTHGDYDLLLIETTLAQADNFQIVQKIKHDNLCRYIAFCSHKGHFELARKGILIGVSEYFTVPFDAESFIRIFEKIRLEKSADQIDAGQLAGKLVFYFEKQDAEIYRYMEEMKGTQALPQVLDGAVKEIFEHNDWLDLYYNEDYFYAVNTHGVKEQKGRFCQLFESSCQLKLHHDESLREVIRYILYNPESDLRQKALSEKLHLNKSYLSTVFNAQTGVRFVDYITYVKLMRAAWLLKNTNVKIGEIAERMDYKDIAYFSRLFKKHFHMTPSEYRIPDSYQFDI